MRETETGARIEQTSTIEVLWNVQHLARHSQRLRLSFEIATFYSFALSFVGRVYS